MTEPLFPIKQETISGTSILEGMTKVIQQIPKDKRHSVQFSFETQLKSQTIEANLSYMYRDNLTVEGYVSGSVKGEVKVGGQIEWRF